MTGNRPDLLVNQNQKNKNSIIFRRIISSVSRQTPNTSTKMCNTTIGRNQDLSDAPVTFDISDNLDCPCCDNLVLFRDFDLTLPREELSKGGSTFCSGAIMLVHLMQNNCNAGF